MFLQWVTGLVTGIGCLLVFWMWALMQLNRVNPASLFYIACNVGGFLLLGIGTLIDMQTNVFDGWIVQILGFIVSTWATALFFKRKK